MPGLQDTDRLLRPAELAVALGWTLSTVYSKASRRQIPFVKIGRSLRFKKSDLDRLIRSGERPALRGLGTVPKSEEPDEE